MHDPIVDVKFSTGEIWIVQVSNKKKQKLTAGDAYRTPIFQSDGSGVIALRQEEVLRIPLKYNAQRQEYEAGPLHVLGVIPGVTKIVGYNEEHPDEILYCTAESPHSGVPKTIGFFSVSRGTVTKSLPAGDSLLDDDNMTLMGEHLMWWTRVYGDTVVDVGFSSKELGENPAEEDPVDVFYGRYPQDRERGTLQNLSNCVGDICGQPSLSHDKQQVVFIRQLRR